MNIVCVVPVRMGSSRLPGKILMPVNETPLLGHLLNRLALCHNLSSVIIATSTDKKDKAIANYCKERNIPCFQGSEENVLNRLTNALNYMHAEIGVLVFGDCPLVDPAIVDELVNRYLENLNHVDFLSNDLKTSYPPGMEVEVFSMKSLNDAEEKCNDPAIREHGTLYIRQNPERYRLHNIEAPHPLNRPELELEVDTEEDMIVIKHIFDHFSEKLDMSLEDIIHFMDNNPRIKKMNINVPRRWKAFRNEHKTE
ncbi:MAG: glycosyltransferase family protein [Methylocystaceae bacterium]|nr:glycosyltransferase family protein [Methylocystaceae bacterium]